MDSPTPPPARGLPAPPPYGASALSAGTYAGVVDGANRQRRALVNPDVVTVREQLGRGPFTP